MEREFMRTGDKIAAERKKINYTQEQLADALKVTRQTISKWETNLAYPETDKLIALSYLFNCSVDYLLKDNVIDPSSVREEEKAPSAEQSINGYINNLYYEYKSEKTLFGLPLVHVNWGFRRKARGIIAIGVRAEGIISIGIFPLGIISLGVCSLGLFSFGALAVALLASFGAVSVSFFALGAIAIGIISNGALSVGEFASGALAIGNYAALGNRAYGQVTVGESYSFGTVYKEIGYRFSSQAISALEKVVPDWLRWIMNWFISIVR
jgi:transcriptional regulator with XRE-family HTH domain